MQKFGIVVSDRFVHKVSRRDYSPIWRNPKRTLPGFHLIDRYVPDVHKLVCSEISAKTIQIIVAVISANYTIIPIYPKKLLVGETNSFRSRKQRPKGNGSPAGRGLNHLISPLRTCPSARP